MADRKQLCRMQADFCKFMAHEKRLEILMLLGEHEMCVEDLASTMEVHVPNISQHLAMMRERGAVTARRDGAHMYYRIAHPKIMEICTLMKEVMIELKQQQMAWLSEDITTIS